MLCCVCHAALEDCEVIDSSEFEIGAGYATDPGEVASGDAVTTQRPTETIASGMGAVNEVLEWMPVGFDKDTPSSLSISREFMGKMATEQQLAM